MEIRRKKKVRVCCVFHILRRQYNIDNIFPTIFNIFLIYDCNYEYSHSLKNHKFTSIFSLSLPLLPRFVTVKSYQQVNDSLRKKLEESNANISNADIDLIKNLVIGYISAPNATAKNQILKLISTVLHLNDAECIKIGLKSAGLGAWFSGSNDSVNNNRSLTEAFVAFLEKESEPRVNANLLTIHETETATAVSRKSSTASSPSEAAASATAASNSPQVESGSSSVTLNLNDNALLTPYSNRNSSTILKDLLHDT